MEKPLRIAIIGAGARALEGYGKHFRQYDPAPHVVAVADPNPVFLDRTLRDLELTREAVRTYDTWEALLDHETELDAAVIGTPNHLHYGPAMILLHRRVPFVLEKPMATTEQACRDIHLAAQASGVSVQLGFVLRSAPMYRKIRDIIDSGVIGQVISIQADEFVGPFVSSILFRGSWRRQRKYSGGAMLEKCCHDMDLITWMAGSRPVAVHSFGGRRTFTPNAALADRCPDCPAGRNCAYARDIDKLVDSHERRMGEYLNETDACIYNLDSDLNDYQSVQLQYENGVIANFMLNFNASRPRGSRSMTIVGSRGTLWGYIDEMKVFHAATGSRETIEHPVEWDRSGHGGGDRTHAFAFLDAVYGRRAQPAVGTWEGYLSAMVCFAADRSLQEARRVQLSYDSDGLVVLG